MAKLAAVVLVFVAWVQVARSQGMAPASMATATAAADAAAFATLPGKVVQLLTTGNNMSTPFGPFTAGPSTDNKTLGISNVPIGRPAATGWVGLITGMRYLADGSTVRASFIGQGADVGVTWFVPSTANPNNLTQVTYQEYFNLTFLAFNCGSQPGTANTIVKGVQLSAKPGETPVVIYVCNVIRITSPTTLVATFSMATTQDALVCPTAMESPESITMAPPEVVGIDVLHAANVAYFTSCGVYQPGYGL
jgi:hypothetical protein